MGLLQSILHPHTHYSRASMQPVMQGVNHMALDQGLSVFLCLSSVGLTDIFARRSALSEGGDVLTGWRAKGFIG